MVKPRINLYWVATVLISLIFVVPHVWLIYFNQNYVYPKRCLVDAIVVFVALALAAEKSLILPQRPILILTGLLAVLKLASTLMFPHWVSLTSLGDSLAFGVFCVYFMTVWEKHQLTLPRFFWVFTVSSLGISAFCLTQYVRSRIMNGVLEPLYFSGPFGNINMLSEYLILFFPLVTLFVRSEKGWRGVLIQLAMVSWIFILLVGRSRSAWIGLGFCMVYGLFQGLSRREWFSYGVALLLFCGSFWIPFIGESYEKAKEGSFSKRAELYKGSSEMLLDHPLGIGGGGFSFNYLPYQMNTKEAPTEREMFDSPHSELLKWGIEHGWAFLAVICLWWLALGILVLKIPGPRELQTFYRTSYLVIGPQLFFQFPFENPGSFYALSFIMALMLVKGKIQALGIKRWGQVALVVLALFFAARAFTQTYNRWIESQYSKNAEMSQLGCDIAPANWKVCFYYSMLAVESLFPKDAKSYIQRELQMRPFDYHALRALAFYLVTVKNEKESCEVVKVYDMIFLGKSTLNGYSLMKCPGIRSPLEFKNSKQFYDDYLKWIAKYQ